MAGEHNLREFKNRQEAANALAIRVFHDLSQGLRENDQVAMVVSGGSSPLALFEMMSSKPLDWDRVLIVPSDERNVPFEHPDSNARMISQSLLQKSAAASSLVSLAANSQTDGLEEIEKRLAQLPWPLCHVILGMGADGHTASLFPNTPHIEQSLNSPRLCIAQKVPGLDSGRISLTIKALLNASRISLLLFGTDKKAVLDAALREGPPAIFPVRAILHQNQVPVDIYWAP